MRALIPILLATCLAPVALADTITVNGTSYAIEDDLGFRVATPVALAATIERSVAAPAPDCADVLALVRRNRSRIESCAATGRPRTVCELLKADLRRQLLGIENEHLGTFAPDATQEWEIAASIRSGAGSDPRGAIATQLSLPRDQVLLVAAPSFSVATAETTVPRDSLSAVIGAAGFLELPTAVELIRSDDHGDDGDARPTLRSRNRLTSCELMSQTLRVQVGGTIVGTYQVPADRDEWDMQWDLHAGLADLARQGYGDKEKWILAGFAITKALGSETPLDSLLPWARFHLKTAAASFELVRFDNRYQLGSKLSQADHNVAIAVAATATGT